MGIKKTKKGENNAFSKKMSLKCQFQVSTSHFGPQKMTMDVGSPMSKCSRMHSKPRLQKVWNSYTYATSNTWMANVLSGVSYHQLQFNTKST
jgi:hypothetical protein